MTLLSDIIISQNKRAINIVGFKNKMNKKMNELGTSCCWLTLQLSQLRQLTQNNTFT